MLFKCALSAKMIIKQMIQMGHMWFKFNNSNMMQHWVQFSLHNSVRYLEIKFWRNIFLMTEGQCTVHLWQSIDNNLFHIIWAIDISLPQNTNLITCLNDYSTTLCYCHNECSYMEFHCDNSTMWYNKHFTAFHCFRLCVWVSLGRIKHG